MKKQFVMAFAAIACGLAFTACSNEDNTGDAPYPHYKVLTFEDKDWGGSTNFVGQKSWSSLIDSPQYGGDLLYPADFDDEKDQLYYWYDQGNTGLYSELLNGYGDGAYWGGGIAISNYVDADLTHGTYLNQLSVPVSNGSSNFAVAFCNSNPTISYYNPQISIKFKNGREYLIKSMKVAPTIYQLNIAKNGDGWAKALTEAGDYMTLTIHGMVGEEETGVVVVDFAREGKFLEGWETIDLTSLGKVDALMFTMETNDTYWGYANQPTYFAFDDVTVQVTK